MNQTGQHRRRFLLAAIAFSGAAVAVPGIFHHARAWANDDSREALIQITRLLYPHDGLPDSVYAEVLDQVLSAVAADENFRSLLDAAERSLGTVSGTTFVEASAKAQLAALKAVESEPFFGAILAAVSGNLYNHPDVWKMLGYGGPSIQMGGYIDHGSGEIDWLPEATS